MTFRTTVLLSAVFTAFSSFAAQAQEALPRERIDAHVKPAIDTKYCVGMVVGVIDETGQQVYAYGTTSLDNGKLPDAETVFEIGALTTLFTSTALMRMIEREELRLDDVVEDLLPAGMRVPAHGGAKILVIHLAAQTSSLPSYPTNWTPQDPLNPFADYTLDDLYAFLRHHSLVRPPGTRYDASAVGYGLLGHVLTLKSGKSYEQLIIDEICAGLEMNETRVTLSEAMKARLADGYNVDFKPSVPWDLSAFEAAGALKSTMNDLLKFAAANAGIVQTPLASAIHETHRFQIDIERETDGAMGWLVSRRPEFVWRRGETGGHKAFIAAIPKQKKAVVVLANTATTVVDVVAMNLAKELAGMRVQPIRLRPSIALPPELLDQYVGQYQLAFDMVLHVTREGDELFLQPTNQPRAKLYAATVNQFFIRAGDAQLTFLRGDDGEVNRVMLEQPGRQSSMAPRMSDNQP